MPDVAAKVVPLEPAVKVILELVVRFPYMVIAVLASFPLNVEFVLKSKSPTAVVTDIISEPAVILKLGACDSTAAMFIVLVWVVVKSLPLHTIGFPRIIVRFVFVEVFQIVK